MDAKLTKIIEEANDYGYDYDNALVVIQDHLGLVCVKMVDTDDPDPEGQEGNQAGIVLVSYGEDQPDTEMLQITMDGEVILVTPTGRNLFRLMYS